MYKQRNDFLNINLIRNSNQGFFFHGGVLRRKGSYTRGGKNKPKIRKKERNKGKKYFIIQERESHYVLVIFKEGTQSRPRGRYAPPASLPWIKRSFEDFSRLY